MSDTNQNEAVDVTSFTEEDLNACWGAYPIRYLLEILNGDYDVQDAKNDLKSLIGSKYDARQM